LLVYIKKHIKMLKTLFIFVVIISVIGVGIYLAIFFTQKKTLGKKNAQPLQAYQDSTCACPGDYIDVFNGRYCCDSLIPDYDAAAMRYSCPKDSSQIDCEEIGEKIEKSDYHDKTDGKRGQFTWDYWTCKPGHVMTGYRLRHTKDRATIQEEELEIRCAPFENTSYKENIDFNTKKYKEPLFINPCNGENPPLICNAIPSEYSEYTQPSFCNEEDPPLWCNAIPSEITRETTTPNTNFIECDRDHVPIGLGMRIVESDGNSPYQESTRLLCTPLTNKQSLGIITNTELNQSQQTYPKWNYNNCPSGTVMIGLETTHESGKNDAHREFHSVYCAAINK